MNKSQLGNTIENRFELGEVEYRDEERE